MQHQSIRVDIRMGHISDIGQVRLVNEDCYCILVSPKTMPNVEALLAVADGIGGHQSGKVASEHVIDALCRYFSTASHENQHEDSSTDPVHFGILLEKVIRELNVELYTIAVSDESYYGMGTTIVAAIVVGSQLFISNVGDSRAYLVRQGKTLQLTNDHSWVAELVQAGLLEPQEARSHPRRNVITRALGIESKVKVDTVNLDLLDRDIIILCTDGLTNLVTDEEILKEVRKNGTPQSTCQALVDLANERGGLDNITVVIAHIGIESKSCNS